MKTPETPQNTFKNAYDFSIYRSINIEKLQYTKCFVKKFRINKPMSYLKLFQDQIYIMTQSIPSTNKVIKADDSRQKSK